MSLSFSLDQFETRLLLFDMVHYHVGVVIIVEGKTVALNEKHIHHTITPPAAAWTFNTRQIGFMVSCCWCPNYVSTISSPQQKSTFIRPDQVLQPHISILGCQEWNLMWSLLLQTIHLKLQSVWPLCSAPSLQPGISIGSSTLSFLFFCLTILS